MNGTGEDATPAYRVVGLNLGVVPARGIERVVVTGQDQQGEMLSWTAELSRIPRLGDVVLVQMHRQEDPPDDSATGGPR